MKLKEAKAITGETEAASIGLASRAPPKRRLRGSNYGGLVVYCAAYCSLLAQLIHLWVLPEHYLVWWAYGMFFLVLAVVQGLYGIALVFWPRRWLFAVGIAANLPVVALYVWTRTFGMPLIGPHGLHVEEVGALDLVATVAEVTLIVLLARLLLAREHA